VGSKDVGLSLKESEMLYPYGEGEGVARNSPGVVTDDMV
jgi:hypothetical protein